MKNVFGENGFQIMFVYQTKLETLELKKKKDTDYILIWKSKGLFTSKLNPLHTPFLHSIKLFAQRMGIKFDKDALTVEQNSYATKIVNAYIVHELDTWSKISLNNFKRENCLQVM